MKNLIDFPSKEFIKNWHYTKKKTKNFIYKILYKKPELSIKKSSFPSLKKKIKNKIK